MVMRLSPWIPFTARAISNWRKLAGPCTTELRNYLRACLSRVLEIWQDFRTE